MSFSSVKPGSVELHFFEDVNTRPYYTPFTALKDVCIGTYQTIMGVWTMVNYKRFGGRMIDQRPVIQGLCEKAAFYCGYNPTYPDITELYLPERPFRLEEVYGGVSIPVPKFPCTTVHVTTGAELNKAVLKNHRYDKFDGTPAYEAVFDLLQKLFPDIQFSREDFLLTCGEEFTTRMHKLTAASLKKDKLDPVIERECENLIERWGKYSENDQAFNVAIEMRHLTSAIITGTLFGNSEHYRELSDAVDFMNIYFIKQRGYTKEETLRYEESCKTFARIIPAILASEDARFFPDDFTIQQKIATCLVFFCAGQESTTFTLSHNFAEIALKPALQNELRDNDLKDFINQQLLKLSPIETLTRKIKYDTLISYDNEEGVKVGKLLRKGDCVRSNISETAKNALETNLNVNYKNTNVFGEGANQCIGKAMALKEINLVMAKVLSAFELTTEEREFRYKVFSTKQAEPFFIKVKTR